jgi:hypothetical protein
MSGLHRRLLDGSTRQLSTVTANDTLMTDTNNQCSINTPQTGGDSSPLSLSASSSLALRRPSTNMLVFYFSSYFFFCLLLLVLLRKLFLNCFTIYVVFFNF